MSGKNKSSSQQPLEKTELNIGFVPLTDSACLAVAKEKGFFSQYGLNVNLSKEPSWANIRDKLAYGMLDAAQMLATMPIASSLGIGGVRKQTVTALVLGVNGNAITLSSDLYKQLQDINPDFDKQRPVSAETLKQLIEIRKQQGKAVLSFAHVFPYSTHNYFLRYWLASAAIDPDRDVNLCVIPPQQMVENLQANSIDGFCAGEPWNQFAINAGIGHALISSYEIWNNAAEKVLGVNQEWALQYPNTHKALMKALIEAAQWIDKKENRLETAVILAAEAYTNVASEIIAAPLGGEYKYHADSMAEKLDDFNLFYQYNASFPWHSQAAWYMSQMQRWGDVAESVNIKTVIEAVYWDELYRQVMTEMGLDWPLSSQKTEGAHTKQWQIDSQQGKQVMSSDLFFDNQIFDFR
ncbi:MAG: ABC transporter substrate-binding protein [Gammaproteobacteria bacterium]|nr:ABC transporter substrate-binding protein [Gammaproteobacteria bacterium]